MVLAYGGYLAAFSHASFPTAQDTGSHLPYLSDKPLGEDAFYKLTVSWRLAGGDGFVYRPGEPTTGVQPLMTVTDAALAWIVRAFGGDLWTFARLTIVWCTLQLIAFAAVVRRLTIVWGEGACPPEQLERAATFAFILTLLSAPVLRQFLYGLETGGYLVLVACCVLWTSRASRVLPGVLAGVTILARVDFAVPYAVYLLASSVGGRIRLRDAIRSGALATAVTLPWFAWVHHVTGGWLPSGGAAESALISRAEALGRSEAMGVALLQQLLPAFPVVAGDFAISRVVPWLGLRLAVALVAIAITLWLVRPWPVTGRQRAAAPLLWGLALLTATYVVCFGPTYFYARYASPLLVFTIPAVAASLSRLRLPPVALSAAAAAIFAAACLGTLHNGRVSNLHSLSAGYVTMHLPDVEIGAFQSGVLSYFDPDVINLDGKMNVGALRAAPPDRMAEYIDARGLQYLVDWAAMLRVRLPAAYLAQWTPCPVPVPGGVSVCLQRAAAGEPGSTRARSFPGRVSQERAVAVDEHRIAHLQPQVTWP